MSKKILLLSGLPGSGKSTEAQRIMQEGGNFYRVNRDALREMLYFSEFRGAREDMVTDLEKLIASDILINREANLIVDDTNLNPKTVNAWHKFAADMTPLAGPINVENRFVDTPIDECIVRDAARERTVGKSVIMGMAMQHGLYKPQRVVLCDLDGTMANLDHRLHYVPKVEGAKKDWKSFFAEIPNDTLIQKTAQLVQGCIDGGADLFYISARPETYRATTEAWLERVGAPKGKALFMRRAHDKREDSLIKKEILHRYFPDKSIIFTVFDDRPRVIRMWQEEGLSVVDCGDGIEF